MNTPGTYKDQEKAEVSASDLAELRTLLLGDKLQQFDELKKRLDDPAARAQETSRVLAEALSLSLHRDRRVQSALHPIVEDSLRLSVEKNPQLLASVLFPIVGKAVRKAVAHTLQNILDSLNSILADGFSLKRWRWRIEAIRSGKSFAEIALARSLAYRVEQVYLIHGTTGLLLAESHRQMGLLQDADLVAGMLTALQDFVRDSFTPGNQDDLEVLHIGEFKLWLAHGPLALLAVVVRGELPQPLKILLTERIEQIHQTFHRELAAFAGSGQPIAGIGAGLDDYLLGQGTEAPATYVGSKIAIAGVLALLAFLLFTRVREDLRWQHYLTALRHEPGIVIVEARHGWSSFSLSGLRDPMAREPRTLLPAFHLSESKVAEQWESYLSLDPRFASARRLDAEANQLRKAFVRFEVNSTQIPLDQLPLVDTVSDQIRQLRADAGGQGKQIHVKVYGHTDPTGAESHNAELSQERAQTMVRMLVDRGVDPSLLSAQGLGDTQPYRAGADPYEQNLDRRVTLEVSFR